MGSWEECSQSQSLHSKEQDTAAYQQHAGVNNAASAIKKEQQTHGAGVHIGKTEDGRCMTTISACFTVSLNQAPPLMRHQPNNDGNSLCRRLRTPDPLPRFSFHSC